MVFRTAARATLLGLAVTLCLVPGCPGAEDEGSGVKVVIIGVDGADMDIIEPMVRAGELPAMKRMMEEGASGKLKTIQPILSPIIWTTIATGRTPDVHGIRDFVVRNPRTGQPLPVSSLQRRCDAVWDILGRKGKSVGIIGWLASWPAEPVNGFMITERMGLLAYEGARREDDEREERVYPAELLAEVEPWVTKADDVGYPFLGRFLNISEEEYATTYTRRFTKDGRIGNMRLLLATAETNRRAGLELYRARRPDFFASYFELVDAACHFFMPFAPPQRGDVTDEDFKRFGGAVAEAYRYTDEIIAEIMAEADENTVVMVMSDHGFRSGRQRLKEGSGFHDPHGARWHRPYGAFLAWGKGVKAGVRVKGASVLDITPTVLGLMGFRAAKDMRGRFLAEAFDVEPPEERVDTYETGRIDRILDRLEERGSGGSGDDQVLAQLKALGYIGEASGSMRDHLNVASFLLSDGRLDEAEKELKAAFDADPDNATIHMAFAGLCARRSLQVEGDARKPHLEQAAEWFESALKEDRRLTNAALGLARIRNTLEQKDKALAAAKMAVEADPENAYAHLFLGKVHRRYGRYKDGEAAILKAVSLEPDMPEARRMLGKIHLARQEFKAASIHFQAAVDLEPEHITAWNELGVTFLRWAATATPDPQTREERYDRAVEIFSEMIESWPRYAKAYHNRAQVRLVRNQRDMALADLQKALEIDPEYAEARQLLRELRRGGRPPPGR